MFCNLIGLYFVLFYEMLIHVRPQEKTEERLRKTSIILTDYRKRRHGMPCITTWEKLQGVQDAEDRNKGNV